jgi:hypothetical protein
MVISCTTSEEFLASLVEGLPGVALMVLSTYRPGYRPAWLEKSYRRERRPWHGRRTTRP